MPSTEAHKQLRDPFGGQGASPFGFSEGLEGLLHCTQSAELQEKAPQLVGRASDMGQDDRRALSKKEEAGIRVEDGVALEGVGGGGAVRILRVQGAGWGGLRGEEGEEAEEEWAAVCDGLAALGAEMHDGAEDTGCLIVDGRHAAIPEELQDRFQDALAGESPQQVLAF